MLFFAFFSLSAKHDLSLRRRIMAKNLENLRSFVVAVAKSFKAIFDEYSAVSLPQATHEINFQIRRVELDELRYS